MDFSSFCSPKGNFDVYQFLSEKLKNINPATNEGITPLHIAGKNDHLKVYKFISENTLDMNPCMFNGITPLHLAARNGHLEVCKIRYSFQH